MCETKRRILVVEDADGVAAIYSRLLADKYDLTICYSGTEARALMQQAQTFDLTIMDIVLPPEEKNLTLADAQRTGLRLMAEMVRRRICSRFYVITVVKDAKPEVEELGREPNVAVKFQYKLDTEYEDLVPNIEDLLGKEI